MKMISISELEETLEMDEWMGLDRHRNQPVVYIKILPMPLGRGNCADSPDQEVMHVGENQLSDWNVVESLVYVNALEYIPRY